MQSDLYRSSLTTHLDGEVKLLKSERRFFGQLGMVQYGVAVSRDDSEPSVLGSARTEASVCLGASGDLRAEAHTHSSSRTSINQRARRRCLPLPGPAARAQTTLALRIDGVGQWESGRIAHRQSSMEAVTPREGRRSSRGGVTAKPVFRDESRRPFRGGTTRGNQGPSRSST